MRWRKKKSVAETMMSEFYDLKRELKNEGEVIESGSEMVQESCDGSTA